jgi:hypothetical protein
MQLWPSPEELIVPLFRLSIGFTSKPFISQFKFHCNFAEKLTFCQFIEQVGFAIEFSEGFVHPATMRSLEPIQKRLKNISDNGECGDEYESFATLPAVWTKNY